MSNLDPGGRSAPRFPQYRHGSIRLTGLFNDQAIIEYLVTRYGDFVLYRPQLKITTLLLWFGPLLLLVDHDPSAYVFPNAQ